MSDVTSDAGQPAAPAAGAELPEEVKPIGSFGSRSAVHRIHFRDPACLRQLEALERLEAENRQPGANLTTEAERVANHPELRELLRKSDRIADPKVIRGRADLVRQRRFGVLRILEGEDRGLPIHQPVPYYYPMPQGQGFWLLRVRDELEWLTMIVSKPTVLWPHGRPTKDRLNHTEARAILDWTAFCLDDWLSSRHAQRVGGRISIEGSRGVMFETAAFIRWVYSLMN